MSQPSERKILADWLEGLAMAQTQPGMNPAVRRCTEGPRKRFMRAAALLRSPARLGANETDKLLRQIPQGYALERERGYWFFGVPEGRDRVARGYKLALKRGLQEIAAWKPAKKNKGKR